MSGLVGGDATGRAIDDVLTLSSRQALAAEVTPEREDGCSHGNAHSDVHSSAVLRTFVDDPAAHRHVDGTNVEWTPHPTRGRARVRNATDRALALPTVVNLPKGLPVNSSPTDVARAAFQAYVDKDRAALESLLTADFQFTSPLDNHLDRATYLARCWPNSASMKTIDIVHASDDGERVYVVYELTSFDGKRFRNAEVHTVRDDKLASVEVYFGWDLPHKAPPGSFVDEVHS